MIYSKINLNKLERTKTGWPFLLKELEKAGQRAQCEFERKSGMEGLHWDLSTLWIP